MTDGPPRRLRGQKGFIMIERTRHAHTNFNMAIPFVNKAQENGGAVRFKSSGFMDLTVEDLETNDCYGNPIFSITHYGEQNGDAMRDPDMTFSINRETETIIPLSFQNDYRAFYQEVITRRNGKLMYCVSMLRELDDFLWMWLKNIKDQGFSPDRFEVI